MQGLSRDFPNQAWTVRKDCPLRMKLSHFTPISLEQALLHIHTHTGAHTAFHITSRHKHIHTVFPMCTVLDDMDWKWAGSITALLDGLQDGLAIMRHLILGSSSPCWRLSSGAQQHRLQGLLYTRKLGKNFTFLNQTGLIYKLGNMVID